MAWTQTDLDALDAAIASGERTVQYDDRSVTYRSPEEQLHVRAVIKRALDAAAEATSVPKQVRMFTRKGW